MKNDFFYGYDYEKEEFEDKDIDKNDTYVIKIEENYDKILFESKMNVINFFYLNKGDKFLYLKNNLIPQLITVRGNYVEIEELF